tara:strand:- start:931 stop:1440 length:510 start_codon:yes stop_codon:yes gene_type:complete
MKKLYIILFILPLIGFGQIKKEEGPNRNGEYKRWCENGQLSEVAFYIDGKVNGEFREYWCNGNIAFEGTYVNDNPVGVQRSWYEDGNLEMERYILEEYNDFYKELQKKTFYVFHGAYKRWYENGILEREVNYVNGEKDGTSTFYSESGKLTKETDYKKGIVIRECIYKE